MIIPFLTFIAGGDSPSNIKMNIDFNSSNKSIYENPMGDDNASPSNRNYKNYETGGITPIREPQDDGTTIGGEEHATAIELQMYDNHEDEYEIFDLRIIHRKNRFNGRLLFHCEISGYFFSSVKMLLLTCCITL